VPSNIVRAEDGYYYSLFESVPYKFQARFELCVMRTDTLGDPASWRAWDGAGFNLRMTSPYVTGASAPLCAGLRNYNPAGHLTYNTYLQRYMQVAVHQQWINGRYVCGIFFALSSDLIHWSERQLLAEAIAPWDTCDTDPQGLGVLEPVLVAYPSIIDHADTTINFEQAGRMPYLYYTRENDPKNFINDRDVVRVPLTLTILN
jgi:hypothetical protein